MNEIEILSSLSSLRRQSRASLVLVLLGAGFLTFSVYYSASRLTPLEQEIASKTAAIANLKEQESDLRSRVARLQASYDSLKINTESLYSVRVTPNDKVYEVKATAKATGRMIGGKGPEYNFYLFINSPPATLNDIAAVTYRMNHESFDQKVLISTDSNSKFSTSYHGWGCLQKVGVSVLLKSGVTQEHEFDMCRSLWPK